MYIHSLGSMSSPLTLLIDKVFKVIIIQRLSSDLNQLGHFSDFCDALSGLCLKLQGLFSCSLFHLFASLEGKLLLWRKLFVPSFNIHTTRWWGDNTAFIQPWILLSFFGCRDLLFPDSHITAIKENRP